MCHYEPSRQHLEWRHYLIRHVPTGVSKGVKRVVKAESASLNALPSLRHLDDISDFVLGQASDSEDESTKTAVRLVEVGPRMSLRLLKIESDFFEG